VDESAFYSNNFAPGVLITSTNVFAVEIHQPRDQSIYFFDLECLASASTNRLCNLTAQPMRGFQPPVDLTLRATPRRAMARSQSGILPGATKLGNQQPALCRNWAVSGRPVRLDAKATINQGVAATSSAVNIR